MQVRPIKNESDYRTAMRRIEGLWGAPLATPEGDELEILVTLAEAYERQHYPSTCPTRLRPLNSAWNSKARTTRR